MLDSAGPDEAELLNGLTQTRRNGAVNVEITSVRMQMAVVRFAVFDWTERVKPLFPASGRMPMGVALTGIGQPRVDVIPR